MAKLLLILSMLSSGALAHGAECKDMDTDSQRTLFSQSEKIVKLLESLKHYDSIESKETECKDMDTDLHKTLCSQQEKIINRLESQQQDDSIELKGGGICKEITFKVWSSKPPTYCH